MDRLHELEVFVAVAEAGSLAKAGARLRLSPPAVTRAIAALEERLGARVFHRTTRSLSITDVGQRFLDTARRILAELDAAERDAVGDVAAPSGHLTVTSSVTFGRTALLPAVRAFLAQYPLVSVSVLLVDRVTNLVEEGIDVAVRIGPLPDSRLIAKTLGAVRQILVASPEYVARRGQPMVPADLSHHDVIAFTGLMPNREWRYLDGRRGQSVGLHPRLEVNDALAALAAAEAGDGVTLALSYMVGEQVRAGRLVPLLDAYTPAAVPVSLVYPETRLIAPKVRAFLESVAPRLRTALDRL